jgi:hypothetical protein
VTQWRYIFTDLVTGQLIAPNLPLSAPSFTSVLNDVGTFNATITLGDEKVMRQNPMAATVPMRTALFAAYGNQLVWGGIITGRVPAKKGPMSIDGKEFMHYFSRREVRSTLAGATGDGHAVTRDQFEIARWLLQQAFDQPNGKIGNVDLPPTTTSGITRIQGYDPWDLKKVLAEWTDLANETDGFDWGQELYWDPATGLPRARLMYYYPKRGVTAKDTNLVITNENSDWSWPEDGEPMTTTRYGTGQGDGAARIIVPISSPEILQAGWPLLEEEDAYSDIGDRDRIARWTQAQQDRYRLPVTLPSVTLRAGGIPAIGAYQVGDWFQLRLEGWNFPSDDLSRPGIFNGSLRLDTWTVTPKDNRVSLTLATS